MSAWSLHPQLMGDTYAIASLPLSDALLMNDCRYPWIILVPRRAGAREWIDLEETDQQRLLREMALASRALQGLCSPDKLNVAALGNMVPQLHLHVIARFRDDAAWPRPVWGASPAVPYSTGDAEERVARLHALLTPA